MSESAVTSTFAMGLLVYWILVGSPCSFAWTNLPLRKSHLASINTLFMTSRVHVSPGTPRNDSVLKSLRSLSDFFHSAVALSSSLTPSASDFQTPVAKPATAMQPPSAGWSSGGVSFPVGGQTDRHERMWRGGSGGSRLSPSSWPESASPFLPFFCSFFFWGFLSPAQAHKGKEIGARTKSKTGCR
jgi:hypothetical protein